MLLLFPVSEGCLSDQRDKRGGELYTAGKAIRVNLPALPEE